MNQTQRNYALQRADESLRFEIKKIREKYTKPAVEMTCSQRFDAFKKGEYTIKKNAFPEISTYTDIVDIVSFNGERPAQINHKAIDREVEKVRIKYSRMKDKLMCSTVDATLKILQEL